MTDVHSIRLRKTWYRSMIGREEADVAADTIGDGLAGDRMREGEPACSRAAETGPVRAPRTVRYVRRFHRPTGLEPHETVFLVVEPSVQLADVCLNGAPLTRIDDHDPPYRFEITARLQDWNELALDTAQTGSDAVPEDARPVDPPANVRLEIHGVGGRLDENGTRFA